MWILALAGKGLGLISGKAWLYVAVVAGVGFVAWWLYSSGVQTERARQEAAILRRNLEIVTRDRDTALAIQTKMAERAAELRVENEERRKAADELVDLFQKQSDKLTAAERSRGFFSDAERGSLSKRIPITRRRSNSGSR